MLRFEGRVRHIMPDATPARESASRIGAGSASGRADVEGNLDLNTVVISQNTAHGGQGGDRCSSEGVYGDGSGGDALGG